MQINELIATELEYFAPIISKQQSITPEQIALWRSETIAERRKRISLEVFNQCNGEVRYGPFKGLKLSDGTWWGESDLGAQCLGIYETELLNFIENIQEGQFSNFIDIGAADGYYAIGILNSKKIANAICFECSTKGQQVIKNNWAINNSIGSLTVLGEANLKSIEQLTPTELDNALVLIDIEGFEFELLNQATLEKLKHCTVFLEIHNWVDNFIDKYQRLLTEASQFFDIAPIDRMERTTTNIEELRNFPDDNRLLLASEGRPCLMRFLQLTPKIIT